MSLEEAVKWLMTYNGMVISRNNEVRLARNDSLVAVFTDNRMFMKSTTGNDISNFEKTLALYKEIITKMKLSDTATRFKVYKYKCYG